MAHVYQLGRVANLRLTAAPVNYSCQDAAGEPALGGPLLADHRCKTGKRRLACARMGRVCQPGRNTDEVECCGNQQVEQARLDDAMTIPP